MPSTSTPSSAGRSASASRGNHPSPRMNCAAVVPSEIRFGTRGVAGKKRVADATMPSLGKKGKPALDSVVWYGVYDAFVGGSRGAMKALTIGQAARSAGV